MNKLSAKHLFGKKVRQYRLQAGLSQEALAYRCNLDRTYISGIERGLRNPTLDVMNSIAEGLGLEMRQLIDF